MKGHEATVRNDNQKERNTMNMTEQMAGAGTGTGPTSVPCPAHPISPCGCDERTGAQPAANAGSGGKLERRLAK